MCLEMLPKGCNRVAISYIERKIVPESQGVMKKVFVKCLRKL